MVIVALTHTLRGNCSVCQLLRWSEASICPHTSLLGVSGLFVLPSQKEEICSTWFIFKIKQSSTKRTISPPHSDYMAERNPPPSLQHTSAAMLLLFLLAHAADSLHHTISCAASFRLIWIFMNVVERPHSIIREIAWHGAPNPFTLLTSVWEPCTSSNCSLYFTVPGCHQCCWCYWEKWEAKNSMGKEGGEQSSQVKSKKKNL